MAKQRKFEEVTINFSFGRIAVVDLENPFRPLLALLRQNNINQLCDLPPVISLQA